MRINSVWLLRNSRTTDSPDAAKSAEFLFCLVPHPAACALLRNCAQRTRPTRPSPLQFLFCLVPHRAACVLLLLLLSSYAQSGVPMFQYAANGRSYTLLGHDPAAGGTTTIPTVLIPTTFSFESNRVLGKPIRIDATSDVPLVLNSPIFRASKFAAGGATQYADALLRATFPDASSWHTLLGKPEVMKAISITIPAGFGYVLTSKRSGRSVAIVDLEFVRRELFQQIPKQDGKLVIALTHNTSFYADGDATVCCSWGTHGSDPSTGTSFLLASYLRSAPDVVTEQDVQPLTEQLGEFSNDPLHNPSVYVPSPQTPGNSFPPWMRPASMPLSDQGHCGGAGLATSYFLLEPTDTNPKNNFPASKPFLVQRGAFTYHVQNVALLPWYIGSSGTLGRLYSFPDVRALTEAAARCPGNKRGTDDDEPSPPNPNVTAAELSGPANGHQLIGYWVGYRTAASTFSLRDVSPQWDVIIVAFATPDQSAPEGTLQFHSPAGLSPEQFKADIAYVKSKGKRVMISLGGGGQHFTLADPKRVPNFVSSVTSIVNEYDFDGIDIDFESPSLSIAPGDIDFRHPMTPSIVNLISALRQLWTHFGPQFMISLVPEGTQIPGGYPTYGGQFGSYLPIAYALRDILSFMDVQDYNTPPLAGLDGEIYQAGSTDYHAAMTELLLHGFKVGGNPSMFFPAMPPNKVAVGFLTGDATPPTVVSALDYIITGKAPKGSRYKMLKADGYPGMKGAMFWTIDDDRRSNYSFSNAVGPELHGYPLQKIQAGN